MKSAPSVKMSGVSKFFFVANKIRKSYNNQMVFEGEGDINLSQWEKAVQIASEANIGSRYMMKGFLNSCRWVDSGITPRIREVDGKNWNGMGPGGAPFLRDPLPNNGGALCEILIVHGTPLRIIFRTHHSIMDGRGTTTWVEDIFRALRGEPVCGSDPTITDAGLLNMKPNVEKPITDKYIAPTGNASGDNYHDFTWIRRTITGKFKHLVPKTMLLIAKEAWKHSDGKVKIGIPVDLRSRKPGIVTTNNLINILYLEVKKDATAEGIADELSSRLNEKIDGAYTWEDKALDYIPLIILQKFLEKDIVNGLKTGQFRYSGCVSNMGRLSLKPYTGGGFTPNTTFFIPPSLNNQPFFLAYTGTGDKIELTVTLPQVLATDGRIERVVENIVSGIHTL